MGKLWSKPAKHLHLTLVCEIQVDRILKENGQSILFLLPFVMFSGQVSNWRQVTELLGVW